MSPAISSLPRKWENFLSPHFNLTAFYYDLRDFVDSYDTIIPEKHLIFNVFNYMNPEDVRCVLYGEDPYPRPASACGVAFWDKEIKTWHDKTNGNSLKNMLKALLVAENLANYQTKISECREIAEHNTVKAPNELFEHWLKQGVLLINTAMTYSAQQTKREHFGFWQAFHKALIKALNAKNAPYYILWGKKAQSWENEILKSIDTPDKIIKQGHPTFIHQFLKPEAPHYSPFTELKARTGINWL